jgi:hypothetical protein
MKTTTYRNPRQHSSNKKQTPFQQPFFSTNSPGAVQRKQEPAFFQAKLTVGQPNDKYEKEADAVANAVVNRNSPAPALQQKEIGQIQRMCPECEKEKMGNVQQKQMPVKKDEELMQRKSDATAATASSSLSSRIESSSGKGTTMPAKTLSEMSTSFGQDFSHVNIHTDTNAVQMNKELNAQAFTHGSDIYFNNGKYNPESSGGRQLLAHELTHVVQQGSSIQPKKIQRTIGDGHDLNAVRFSGNATLEAVYDNERVLSKGSKGAAVRILQQALLDAGMSLPVFGVDGDFGTETETAVKDFQTASGLSAGGVDGIVGPTTMGWLDQLFATSPTPAGTSPGATTGCAAFKNVTIDFVTLHGSNRNAVKDFNFLNSVFNQACVKFTMGTGVSVSEAATHAMLGGDNDVSRLHSCSAASAEEESMRSTSTGSFGLASKIKVFYVDSMTPALNGVSFPPFCSSGTRAPFLFHTYISNSANDRTLAHEIGHQLLNCLCHTQADAFNVMVPNGPGSNLDAAQEATIFANA